MKMTRRRFLEALGVAGVIGAGASCGCRALPKWMCGGPRHRSDYDGIRIGAITYSFSQMAEFPKDATKKFTLAAGLGSVELMDRDFERDIGVVHREIPAKYLTKEQKVAISQWRETADMKPLEDLRAAYEAAGIGIHIVKFGDIGCPWMYSWKEAEYMFKATRALGARVITREVPKVADWPAFKETAEKLIPLMNEYDVDIAFHNHAQIAANTYDGLLLNYSDHFKINFDIGNYVASYDEDPLAFVKKYQDKLVSIHVKDRKRDNGPELPFGTGDTPLKELFAMMKRENIDVPCDIEVEFPIPEGSTAVRETDKCREYCRRAILG